MYCNVLLTKPFDHTFTYKTKFDRDIKPGTVVSVPFGKKQDQIGIIYELCKPKFKIDKKILIKEIKFIHKDIILNNKIIQFIDWIADYTLAPKGLVLKLFLVNINIIKHKFKEQKEQLLNPQIVLLNTEQKKVFETINKSFLKPSQPIVLEGVTGSGKTEVYFEAIEKILSKKKQALIMLPEISLTPQLESRFKKRFGFTPDLWHSKISEKKRKHTWHRCFVGKSIIVVGARSSLFLPFKNLGLIVVDEEHDLSFKQEDNIRYHARDLAIVKSKIEKFPIILCSATPSLETFNNVQKGKFVHVNIFKQFSGLELPIIELINLQNEKLEKNKWISSKIFNEIKNCVEKGEQALLFLNRRGYSPLCLCSDCGYRYQCDHCSTWLVLHRNKKRLLCHHCGTIYPIKSFCFQCKAIDSLKLIGPGVERLEEEIKEFFPQYKISIMSSDNANTPAKIKKIIDDFTSKKIDILIATQIMSKGYDFPNLSLVGVIDADSGLMGGDIRAIERTYNLLQQVSGRAGRSQQPGKVLIQTYYPDQPVIQSLKKRSRQSFIEQILLDRKQFNVPPFSFMTAIIISGSSRSIVKSYSINLSRALTNNFIDILGPVEAPLFLLRGKFRYRLLLKSKNRRILNNFTRNLIKTCPSPSSLRLIIDVDPYTFL